jgi:hypothetical protein
VPEKKRPKDHKEALDAAVAAVEKVREKTKVGGIIPP